MTKRVSLQTEDRMADDGWRMADGRWRMEK